MGEEVVGRGGGHGLGVRGGMCSEGDPAAGGLRCPPPSLLPDTFESEHEQQRSAPARRHSIEIRDKQ